MKWGTRYAFRKNISAWHTVFAWYPVQLLTGEWIWLETVECRLRSDYGGSYYEYREIGTS